MDLSQLSVGLDYVAANGIVLGTERRVAVQTSLVLLKNAEKLKHIAFWGKVLGVSSDYYIAQGYNDDPFTRKTFMSVDCIKWAQLPDAHPVLVKAASSIRTRFTGNPSHEYTVKETGPASDEERPNLPAEVAAMRKEETTSDGAVVITTTLSEERRLAAVVASIDAATRIVPRGAFRKTPSDAIEACRTFQGLTVQDGGKLDNYLHCREPLSLLQKSAVERARLDPALDFLDSLADDIPKGCWSIQYQKGAACAALRSLHWPGFVFYHALQTPMYGHVYVGTGLANTDLIFML
jgi:radial spoke head protein 9